MFSSKKYDTTNTTKSQEKISTHNK